MPDASGTYTLTGVINSPITREAEADAAITYNIQGAPDTFNITSDTDSTVFINQTLNVPDMLNLTANGGTIELSDDQTNDQITATIENGGSFITNGYLRGTASTGSVTFGDGGGVLVLGLAGTFRGGTLPQMINGFTNNADVIDAQALKFSGITGYTIAAGSTSGQQVITIDDGSGVLTFTVSSSTLALGSYDSVTNGPLDLFTDSTGGTNISVQSELDQSGTYTLTGVAGMPISREAASGAAVTYDINGDSDTFTITANTASTVAIDQTVYFADDLDLVANGGTISLSANQSNDTINATIENDGSFVTNGYFGDTSPLSSASFGVGGGSLVVGASRNYHSANAVQLINGFTGAADAIDDHSLKFSGITGYTITTGSYSGQDELITIDDSSGNFEFTTAGTLFATGNYTSLSTGPLHLFADSTGGTTLVACYCVGTRIATPAGEAAVETLRIGDLVTTLAGAARPVRWIGRRSYAGRFASGNRDVLPVTIRAGALEEQVPRNDLSLSPLHALFLDGMLIPAGALVNGISIVQADRIESVDYVHVELETHDILLAEGAAAESFVDDDSRAMFHNAHEYHALYPDAVPRPARYCGPRVEHGAELERLRSRLAARARGEVPAAAGSLLGHVDDVFRDRVKGWALDSASPDRPVHLRILDGGVVLCELVADQYRADLDHAGHGNGLCAFDVAIPGGLNPGQRHVLQVQRISDWQNLGGSPWILEAEILAPVAPVAVAVIPPLGWHGQLDMATRDRVRGWAQHGDAPETAVALQVLCDGLPLARVVANLYRSDLAQAGLGSGRHGFEVAIPGGLSPLERHVVQVRRESDGSELPGSPAVIEAAGMFDSTLESIVSRAVAAVAEGDQGRVMNFMLEQAARLAQQMADVASASDRPRALFIDGHVPVATRDAGSRVLLSHMRAMQRLGYAVSLASPEFVQEPPMIAGVDWLGAPLHDSVESILQRQAGRFDVVYLHRVDVASRYMALVRQHMPRARVLYNVADLHHVRVARQAGSEQRPELLPVSDRLRLAETVAAMSADAVLVHSLDELALLRRLAPQAKLHHVPIDVSVRPGARPFGARRGVAFVGGYRHAPNVDAAHVLVDEVMPLVWDQVPGLPCLLIGSDMPDRVRRLAGPHIELAGQVADLDLVLERVRLTTAPLRYGAGVKGKVLDSLAAAVPCVMSPIAAEGLALPTTLQALVGQDVQQVARLIVRLHEDEQAHRVAVKGGLMLIDSFHREAQVDVALEAALAIRTRPSLALAG